MSVGTFSILGFLTKILKCRIKIYRLSIFPSSIEPTGLFIKKKSKKKIFPSTSVRNFLGRSSKIFHLLMLSAQQCHMIVQRGQQYHLAGCKDNRIEIQ